MPSVSAMPRNHTPGRATARKLGRVISVGGARLDGLLDGAAVAPWASDSGDAVETPQVGGLVAIRTPTSIVYGMIGSLRLLDPSAEAIDGQQAVAEIDLIGEALGASGADAGFRNGVSVYPALGAEIYAATEADLRRVYARPKATSLCVGTLHQDKNVPSYLVTDDLLGKHFAVLGTTGSGKSCAITLLLRAVLRQNPNGHVVLLDPHNEYARAFGNLAEVIDTDNLHLPYWLLNFEEISELLIGRGGRDREAEATILKAAILAARKVFAAGSVGNDDFIGVDTPVPYRMTDLMLFIDEAVGRLDRPGQSAPYLKLISKLQGLTADRRYRFMFSGLSVHDNLGDILSRILRIPVSGKPVTIFDMSGVPSEIVDVMVSVLCRIIFDFAVWSEPTHAVPILLVCEEAHRYVPRDDRRGFEPTRRAISRIAKEGRKYGVSLALISQRPSELSTTVLSQCSTLFAMRLANETDRACVRAALPEHALGLLNALPALNTQESIAVGDALPMAMRLRFDDLDPVDRPKSESASFSTAWQADDARRAFVAATVERWRHQDRNAT